MPRGGLDRLCWEPQAAYASADCLAQRSGRCPWQGGRRDRGLDLRGCRQADPDGPLRSRARRRLSGGDRGGIDAAGGEMLPLDITAPGKVTRLCSAGTLWRRRGDHALQCAGQFAGSEARARDRGGKCHRRQAGTCRHRAPRCRLAQLLSAGRLAGGPVQRRDRRPRDRAGAGIASATSARCRLPAAPSPATPSPARRVQKIRRGARLQCRQYRAWPMPT